MEIFITKGVGFGKTKIAAFDNALFKAGIANYNLIPLSSVIPKGSTVKVKILNKNEIEHGHKLYVVISRGEEDILGKEIWTGMGWVQSSDGSGLFVEHVSDSKHKLIDLIKSSLIDMISYRKREFGKIRYEIQNAICKDDRIVCAVVVAVYESESWKSR